MNLRIFEYEVQRALDGKQWLWPVFQDLHDISRRLREEVDDTLFVVRNTLRGRFEVHCLLHKPDTIAWPVPWARLDGRTVRRARETRVELQGDLLRRVDEHNARLEETKRRDFRNWIHGVSEDTRSIFKKVDPWGPPR